MKQAVKVVKGVALTGDGVSNLKIIEGIKKMFWNEVNGIRKGEPATNNVVKDKNGQILWEVEVRKSILFEQVLNMEDVMDQQWQ